MRPYLGVLLYVLATAVLAAPASLRSLDRSAVEARQQADLRLIEIYRAGLARTMDFVRQTPQVFPPAPGEKRLLAEADKLTARATWKTFLDYQRALEGIETFHRDFALIRGSAARDTSLVATFAAHTARYRMALDFIKHVEYDPELAKVLNESMGDLGLPRGAYDRFKFHFLNVAQASQFAALTALFKSVRVAVPHSHAQQIETDSVALWQMGRGQGTTLTLANARNLLKGLGQRAVFPAQVGISEWMGDTKVKPGHAAFISATQIRDMIPAMQPGDMMLQRREWYVSNVGLPGFWSHAALYIGTAAERRAFFADIEVQEWVKSQAAEDFESLLAMRHAASYAQSVLPLEHGEPARVLEAISEGVTFTTMSHSAAADSLVVLRPRLTKRERAAAILRAFSYAGRPYDFDFDFQTDTSLVCTELLYKAYEPSRSERGIRIAPQLVVGRLAVPANDYAKDFDSTFGTAAQQWDMVLFLDGLARQKRAVVSDVAAFRESWKRPKWHILLSAPNPKEKS